MQGTIWLVGYGWRYETGITLVGVVGFIDNQVLQIAVPGFDFAFTAKCNPQTTKNRTRVEAEIRQQIKRRFPQLFPKKARR